MKNLTEKIKLADSGDDKAMTEVAHYIIWDDEIRPFEPELLEKSKILPE